MLQVGKSNGSLWCFTAFFLPPEFREADKPLVYLVVGLVQGLVSQAQGAALAHVSSVSDLPPSVYMQQIWNLHRELMGSLVSRRFPWLYLLWIINVTEWVDEHFSVGVNRQGGLENEWTAKINCKAARLNSLVRDSEGSANAFISKRFLY